MRISIEELDKRVEGSIAVSLMRERGLVPNRAKDGGIPPFGFGGKLHQALTTRCNS
jgi:hypothetical protein